MNIITKGHMPKHTNYVTAEVKLKELGYEKHEAQWNKFIKACGESLKKSMRNV